MLPLYAVDRGFDTRSSHTKDLKNGTFSFSCLAVSTLGKITGVKHIVFPDGRPLTVTFAVLAQLCGPKANERKMGAALFTKNGEGMNF